MANYFEHHIDSSTNLWIVEFHVFMQADANIYNLSNELTFSSIG